MGRMDSLLLCNELTFTFKDNFSGPTLQPNGEVDPIPIIYMQNSLLGLALLNLKSNLPLDPVDISSMDNDLRWRMEKGKAKVADVGSSSSCHGRPCHRPRPGIIIVEPDQRTATGLKRSHNPGGLDLDSSEDEEYDTKKI